MLRKKSGMFDKITLGGNNLYHMVENILAQNGLNVELQMKKMCQKWRLDAQTPYGHMNG